MTVNKTKLNDDKIEFIIIGSRVQLNKVNISELSIGNLRVLRATSVRNVGAWFDEKLKMTTHINKICQSVLYHLHNIRHIRKFLTYDNRKLLVQAVIMSRIDYCNSLLFRVVAIHLIWQSYKDYKILQLDKYAMFQNMNILLLLSNGFIGYLLNLGKD